MALAPETRDFLVRTSVLARFTPEMCDAVLGREDSAVVLGGARALEYVPGRARRPRGVVSLPPSVRGGPAARARARAARELRRRAAAWCGAHGLAEEAIEYAAAAGDAEMVAELLIEKHLEFIWGGRLAQFLGWVRWLPAELLVEHPVLPGAGAVAAALLSAPEVEVEQLLAVAERARRERPQLWLPYLEVGVEARAFAADRGRRCGGSDRARSARGRGGSGGGGYAERERPGVLGAGTVLCRRARRDATGGGSGGRATRRAQRP